MKGICFQAMSHQNVQLWTDVLYGLNQKAVLFQVPFLVCLGADRREKMVKKRMLLLPPGTLPPFIVPFFLQLHHAT